MKILTKKRAEEIVNRITANYIIAEHALTHSDISPKDLGDALDHLIDNLMFSCSAIGGEKCVASAQDFIDKYHKKHGK